MKTFFYSLFAGLLGCATMAAADSVVLTLPDQVTCAVQGESPCAPADQIITQRIDTISIGLLPSNGQVHGPAGSTIGWGFTLSWSSNSGDWVRVENSSLSNPSVNNAGYFDIIGFNGGPVAQDAVPPNSQWTNNFNLPAAQGAGGVTLLADCGTAAPGAPCASQGSSDQGNVIFQIAVYDGDPTAGGNLLGRFTFGNCTSTDPSVCAQGSTAYTATVDYTAVSLPPTISFATIPDQSYGEQPVTLSVTPSLAFPVAVTSSTASVCAVSGNSVSILSPGLCVLTASQSGNFQFGSADSVTQSFTVYPATAAINFNPATLTQTYSGSGVTATFTTTPSGLATTVMYDGETAAPVLAGIHQVAVTVNDPNYTGSAAGTLTIANANPVITWPAPSPVATGAALTSAQLDASTSVPGVFTYSPTVGTVLPAGANQLLTAVFTPNDSANYNSVTVTNQISVLPELPPIANAGGPYSFCPNVSNGNPVYTPWYLDGSRSTNPDNGKTDGTAGAPPSQIVSYDWDLSGGTNFSGPASLHGAQVRVDVAPASFLSMAGQTFTVNLRVTNNDNLAFPSAGLPAGLTNVASAQVSVHNVTDPACTHCVNTLKGLAKASTPGVPGSIQVYWTDTNSVAFPIDHYNVYRSANANFSSYQQVAGARSIYGIPAVHASNPAGGSLAFVDSNVTVGGTYYYRVAPATAGDVETCGSNETLSITLPKGR
jgi:hypothetical protein